MKLDPVLKARSTTLLREFEEKHDLHGVIEVTSAKSSHVLVGTYEDRDGRWMARLQPAHLYDSKFRAGTFSLSLEQLDKLIEVLSEVREVLSDQPTGKVHVVKPANRKVAATVAQAPQATAEDAADPVLEAVGKLAKGLEALADRLEALEASVPQVQATKPQKPQAKTQEVKDAIEWQLWHGEAPYGCPVCGKEYKSRGRYLSHVAEAHGIDVEG